MICKSDCRECLHFNKLRMVCRLDKEIMVVPFELKTYLENRSGIESVEEFQEWDSMSLTYKEKSNIFKVRKMKNFFIDFQKINGYLKEMNIELELLEWNRDSVGDYLLMKVKE